MITKNSLIITLQLTINLSRENVTTDGGALLIISNHQYSYIISCMSVTRFRLIHILKEQRIDKNNYRRKFYN